MMTGRMMKRIALSAICVTAPVAGPMPALGATMVAPPAMYPATMWQGRGQAVIRILDRMDSHVTMLTVPAGGETDYKTLHIAVHRCVDRPPTLASDAAIQVSIADNTDRNMHFDGWILAAEPALSVFPSPLYQVRVVSCAGDTVAPLVPPLPQPAVPQTVSATPSGADDQPGDTGDQPAVPPPVAHGPMPLTPDAPTGGHTAPPAGPMQLAPPASDAPPAGSSSGAQSGPMPLTPPADAPTQTPEHLPPPQPFPDGQ